MSGMSFEERRRNLRPGSRVRVNNLPKGKNSAHRGKTGVVREIETVIVDLEDGQEARISPKSLDPIAGE